MLKCVEEWENHVLAKSQTSDITTTHASTQHKTVRSSVTPSDNLSSDSNKSSKPAFNKNSDQQKKHCDEPRKVPQNDHISFKLKCLVCDLINVYLLDFKIRTTILLRDSYILIKKCIPTSQKI